VLTPAGRLRVSRPRGTVLVRPAFSPQCATGLGAGGSARALFPLTSPAGSCDGRAMDEMPPRNVRFEINARSRDATIDGLALVESVSRFEDLGAGASICHSVQRTVEETAKGFAMPDFTVTESSERSSVAAVSRDVHRLVSREAIRDVWRAGPIEAPLLEAERSAIAALAAKR